MKRHRMLFAAVFVVLVASFAAAQNTNSSATTNTNTGAKASAPKPRTPSKASFIRMERGIWEAIKKKDRKKFAGYMASDQLYVNPDGRHSKSETVTGVMGFGLGDYTLEDFKFVMTGGSVIVSYKASGKGTVNGQEMPFNEYHTTVWTNRGGKWVAIFHQETAVR